MRTVLLADEQPELLEQVPSEHRAQAASATAVAVIGVPIGEWSPERRDDDGRGHYGLLVLDGLLARRVHLGNRECVELLGAGDVLRPWASAGENSSISVDARWVVQTEARIALLDRGFAARVVRYPEITAALMDRLVRRSRWLAFHLAVCHLAHLQTRLRVMFWYLADRWGRVTPDGVVVPLRLTHELLGGLVGARRPATTTALGELTATGYVERRGDGSWLLHGDPPPELRDLHDRAAGRDSVPLA
jgi:CRP-like cAMP-binding protein